MAWAGQRGLCPSAVWAGLTPGRVLHTQVLPWWVTFAERVVRQGIVSDVFRLGQPVIS